MEKNSKLTKPRILQGTRDFFPEDMAKRRYTIDRMRTVFVNFGYDAIQTPAIEYAETILGKYGDEAAKLVYRFTDNGGRDIALRYDQTVPFARFVAMNYKRLTMPFKRYQIGRVWRADRPAKGRFREFYQCDIDIIGTRDLLAETEIAAVIAEVLATLGFSDFIIKVNSRRLINSILADLGVPKGKQTAVIRLLDKLEKIGAPAVTKELASALSEEIAKKLMRIVSVNGTAEEKLRKLDQYEVAEIAEFMELARLAGISEKNLIFEPSLARGLDYYTGIIFEAFIPGVDIGAVCAGGRYDDLAGFFSPERWSGVGVAFGFDRIVTAMDESGLFSEITPNTKVLIAYFDRKTLPASLGVLRSIRDAGIAAEMYFEPARLAKQLTYADRKKIPFVVICGSEEAARGEVAVKMMKTGKQKTIPRDQVQNYFKSIVGKNVSIAKQKEFLKEM